MTPPENFGLGKKPEKKEKLRPRTIPKKFTELDFENPEKVSREILTKEKTQEGKKILAAIMNVLSEKDKKEFQGDTRIFELLTKAIARDPRRPIFQILKTDFLLELNVYRKELGVHMTVGNIEGDAPKQLALEHFMTEVLYTVPEDQVAATLDDLMRNSEEGKSLQEKRTDQIAQIEEEAA